MNRRPQQPPIDPALVIPGAQFPKNRAEHIGQPVVYDIVERVEQVTDANGPHERVHYHNSATGRKGSMTMKAFCAGSEHRLPDPPEPASAVEQPDSTPPCGAELPCTPTMADLLAVARANEAKLDELLALLRRIGPAQLSLGVRA